MTACITYNVTESTQRMFRFSYKSMGSNRSFKRIPYLNLLGKGTSLTLVIPLFSPGVWADGLVHLLEVFTRSIVFSLDLLAAVEVNIALPAVS